jgi:hypothetical protein
MKTKMMLSVVYMALCVMGFVQSTNSQNVDVCDGPPTNVEKDSEDRIIWARKGGALCGCSYVSHSHDPTKRIYHYSSQSFS